MGDGYGGKSIDTEISLSISCVESKIPERLQPLVVVVISAAFLFKLVGK